MRKLTFVLAALTWAASIQAAPHTYTISGGGKNLAEFRIDDAVETIVGTTSKIAGTIAADPENVAASAVDVRVELASLDSGIAMRNEHMRERFLETAKYPSAAFRSVSVTGPATIAPNKPAEINVTGDYSMHGVSKRITVPVRIVLIPESELTKSTLGAGNWIHATATFQVRLADYGVHVPDTFLVNTSDPIPVKIDVYASAR